MAPGEMGSAGRSLVCGVGADTEALHVEPAYFCANFQATSGVSFDMHGGCPAPLRCYNFGVLRAAEKLGDWPARRPFEGWHFLFSTRWACSATALAAAIPGAMDDSGMIEFQQAALVRPPVAVRCCCR